MAGVCCGAEKCHHFEAAEDAQAEVPAESADYVGYQFAGTDPWGGNVSITIRSIADGEMEATYTDVLGEDTTLYAEMSGIPIDGTTAPFSPAGQSVEDENLLFSYVGSIELKDGQLVLTYESGNTETVSDQGGSTAYHVEALDENAKTITLTKTVDPTAEN